MFKLFLYIMVFYGIYQTHQDNDWLPHMEFWQSVFLVFGIVAILALIEVLDDIAKNIGKAVEVVKENKK